MLKATATQGLATTFYVTVKVSGRPLTLDALKRLARPLPVPPLRVSALVAKEAGGETLGSADIKVRPLKLVLAYRIEHEARALTAPKYPLRFFADMIRHRRSNRAS